jgi:hypothetical protein
MDPIDRRECESVKEQQRISEHPLNSIEQVVGRTCTISLRWRRITRRERGREAGRMRPRACRRVLSRVDVEPAQFMSKVSTPVLSETHQLPLLSMRNRKRWSREMESQIVSNEYLSSQMDGRYITKQGSYLASYCSIHPNQSNDQWTSILDSYHISIRGITPGGSGRLSGFRDMVTSRLAARDTKTRRPRATKF